jgi:hypothetical protein
MERRKTQSLQDRMAELERLVAETGDPTGALAKVRESLEFERLTWRIVGRRKGDREG